MALGIKSVALYRDGCKASQPFETGKSKATAAQAVQLGCAHRPGNASPTSAARSPTTSQVGGHDGYVTVGLYPDGRPGEDLLPGHEGGSTVNGLMDSLGISMSMALQHGVPLKDLVRKLAHLRFEPAGATNNPRIRFAKSIPDYVARWLALEFLTEDERRAIGLEGRRGRERQRPRPGARGRRQGDARPTRRRSKFETRAPRRVLGRLGRRRARTLPRCADLRRHHGPVGHVLRVHGLRLHERLLVRSRTVPLRGRVYAPGRSDRGRSVSAAPARRSVSFVHRGGIGSS